MGKEFMVRIRTDTLKYLGAKHNTGTRIGQIRVIFKIPDRFILPMFGTRIKPPGTLAYVEWFTRPRHKALGHKMYPVSRSKRSNGIRDASVVEVDSIIRP